MNACDECDSTAGHGGYHVDGEELCRRCYNQKRDTRTPDAIETTDDPHAEQRSRHRVVNNVVNE